jgi:hypothetical protein
MANYVKSTNFLVKDSLTSGDPSKVIKGSEIDTEFSNIQTAVNSKSNTNSPAFTGTPTAPTAAPGTSTTQLATTQFVDTSYSKYAGNNTWTGTNVFTGTILKIPNGNLASRPAGQAGIIRYNTTYNQYEGNKSVAGVTINTLTHASTVATAVTASKHYLATGDTIVVSGCTPSNYNGEFLVTVVDDTTFTYVMVVNPTIDAAGIGTYVRIVWGQLGGGAVGNANNQVFVENDQNVTGDYTITSGKNAMTTGPITINDGVVVTVPSGSTWVIL